METYLLKSTAAMTHFLLLISSLICCAQESWIVVSNTNAPKARTLHSAVWTGNRMIVGGEVLGMFLSLKPEEYTTLQKILGFYFGSGRS